MESDNGEAINVFLNAGALSQVSDGEKLIVCARLASLGLSLNTDNVSSPKSPPLLNAPL
jgi:hypothetical protein